MIIAHLSSILIQEQALDVKLYKMLIHIFSLIVDGIVNLKRTMAVAPSDVDKQEHTGHNSFKTLLTHL